MYTTAIPSSVATPTANSTNCSARGEYAPLEFDISRSTETYMNAVSIIILVFSAVGNILVLRGIRLTQHRPVAYILIGNIAATELISVVIKPLNMHSMTRPWSWVFGSFMCSLHTTLSVCCGMVITFTLAALSVYRCCILTRHAMRASKTIMYAVLGVSWIWGIALAAPFAPAAKVHESYKICNGGYSHHCYAYYADENKNIYLNVVTFICQLTLPFMVIALSYGIVVVIIKQHIQRVEEIEMTETETATETTQGNEQEDESSTVVNYERRQNCKVIQMETNVLRIIYLIVLTYWVCYSPANFVYLGLAFQWLHVEKKMLLYKCVLVLHALPMALHPIFYGWMLGIIQRNFTFINTCRKK